jgi:hypothetical protein
MMAVGCAKVPVGVAKATDDGAKVPITGVKIAVGGAKVADGSAKAADELLKRSEDLGKVLEGLGKRGCGGWVESAAGGDRPDADGKGGVSRHLDSGSGEMMAVGGAKVADGALVLLNCGAGATARLGKTLVDRGMVRR